MNTDVLIVGAGPTGLMLANQLARHGVRARIIDRHAGPSRETRALGVQARTLEIYAKMGVIDRALELGRRGGGVNLWANGRHMAHIPFGDAGKQITPYPFIHILGQDDNERILGDKLREHGLHIEWSTELTALEQKSDRVQVTLHTLDGHTQVIDAGWVAGCDGAHSAVRRFNDIDFPGAPYESFFFVADVEMTGTMVPDEVNVYLWKQGFHLFFPMRGKDHWRLVGIVPPALRDKRDLCFDDVVPSLRAEAGESVRFTQCFWFSTYHIDHRAARHFRAGRCFLLGDAAHIHSPMGAQGMNTGLQDAYNLAWKLALVVDGRANEALLDTYEQERLPIAQKLLSTTDRAFKLVVSDSRIVGLMRLQVAARVASKVMRRERIQRAAFRVVSQTGIHYPDSVLSQALEKLPEGAPRAGDRFPWLQLKFDSNGATEDSFEKLDDTRFNLILFGQPLPKELPELGGLLKAYCIPNDAANVQALVRARIPSQAFYLVRPDGYVGLCGIRADVAAIARYVTERVRLMAPSVATKRTESLGTTPHGTLVSG
ncbi:MAG: FAD-dependent monooxygenase [Steroidobacteraceae bacterium]